MVLEFPSLHRPWVEGWSDRCHIANHFLQHQRQPNANAHPSDGCAGRTTFSTSGPVRCRVVRHQDLQLAAFAAKPPSIRHPNPHSPAAPGSQRRRRQHANVHAMLAVVYDSYQRPLRVCVCVCVSYALLFRGCHLFMSVASRSS